MGALLVFFSLCIAFTATAQNAGRNPCDAVHLQNTSFEQLPNSTDVATMQAYGYVQTNQNNIPYWKTTASDQNIEIWQSGYGGVQAYSGNYFAELNATEVGTLYQPFYAIAPISIVVSFAHRGRYAGMDKMEVSIVDPVGTPHSLGFYSDNDSAWRYYSTTPYSIPSTLLGQWKLQFKSVSSNGGNGPTDGGNFLDSISVLCAAIDPCKDVQLINTSFETILNGQAPSTYVQTDENNIPGWKTTATDQRIEIWKSNYGNVPAYSGNYFAELNATQVGTLYQSFHVTAPISVRVAFAHRGRYAGEDKMDVVIVDQVSHANYPLGTYSDNDSMWRYYTTAPQPLAAGLYQVEFRSISSNNGNGPSNGGNFLDSITVMCTGTDPCYDVWIQRTASDDGTEPLGLAQGYDATNSMTLPWGAPGVWNTVNNPNGMSHQNPAIGQTNVLRVRLTNRGCYASNPGHLYAYLSPVQTWQPVSATSANQYPNNPGANDGYWTGVIGSPYYVTTPSIPANGSVIVNIPWTPPANRPHCCFIVRYENPDDRLKAETTSAIDNSVGDNNIAHKNVDIVDSTHHAGVFSIGNPDSVAALVNLHFKLNTLTAHGSSINSLGIHIILPPPIYSGWRLGGSNGNNISVGADSSIRLTGGARSDLLSIPLSGGQSVDVAWTLDSIATPDGDTLGIIIQQDHYIYPKDSIIRHDDGLVWEIHTKSIASTKPPTGGDTIATSRPTNRPMHVQTYAIYVSNGNQERVAIDRVIVGVEGKSAILAIGPPEDSAKASVSLARDRTGRSYVYHCASDDHVGLYAGEVFRPIYITVATEDTGNIAINYQTLSQSGDTLTDSKVVLTDRLAMSTVSGSNHNLIYAPSLISSYPNPVSTSGTVRFMLPAMAHDVELTILDASGRNVQSILTGETLDAGMHEVNFNTSDLPSGAYFLVLRTDAAQYTSNLKIVH